MPLDRVINTWSADDLLALGAGAPDPPVALAPHVEEDQEEEGAHAPLEGQPRQASQHGTWLSQPFSLHLRPGECRCRGAARHPRRRSVSVARGRRLRRGRGVGRRPQRTNPTGARSPADMGPVARAPFRAHGPADGRQRGGSRRQAVRARSARPAPTSSRWSCARPSTATCRRARCSTRRSAPPTAPSPSTGTNRRPTARSSPSASARVAPSRARCRSIDVDTGDAARRLDPQHPGRRRSPGCPTTRASGTLRYPAGRPVRPPRRSSTARHRPGRRPGGVRRPADAGDVARRDRQRRRPIPARLHARRLGPDRRHAARHRDRRVARRHQRRRGAVVVLLPRATSLYGRHVARRAERSRSSPRRSTIPASGEPSSPSATSCSARAASLGDRVLVVSSQAAVDTRRDLVDTTARVEHAIDELRADQRAVARHRRATRAFVAVASFDAPPTLYRLTRRSRRAMVAAARRPTSLPPLTVTQTTYPSLDGTEIGLFVMHRADVDAVAGRRR